MSAKSNFALPRLKLRGTIILAAGLVFTLAIGSSLLYVISSNHAQDLRQADQMMEALTSTGAQTVSSFLSPYADAADSLARTGTAMLTDPSITSDVYKSVVLRQAEALPGSLGNYLMYTPDAKLADKTAFAGSPYIASRNHVGIYAQRGSDGALTMGTLTESKDATYDDWLTPALSADKSSIVGPDNFGGVLYTTFNSIIRNGAGKGVGVSGVAFDANALGKQIFENVKIGQGLLGVINQNGVWIVHMDPTMVGKQATDGWVTDAQKALETQPFYHASVGSDGTQFALAVTKANIPGSTGDWMVLVGMPEAALFADSNAQANSLMIGGGVILLIGLVAFGLLGAWVAKPVSKMNAVMLKIADGAYDVDVPYARRKDEIGDMAKAVEVFRQNGQRVAEMTEADAARIIRDQQARAAMMAELQREFGQVVDAAVAGDFSRRVDAEFPDAELNALAGSVNNLVATVDRGLGETGEVLAALADTDLTKRMEGAYEGAFARLRDDTNAVADKLSGIVAQLKETSRSLKTATGEILSGANDLSERTTKQAATIEETSAAMEQLASTVMQNAERAKEASHVASTVTRTAEEGGQVMGEANMAMERITASSAKISNIIGLIDDIAFQTNLLALNASVEAARAGDAGKGFAVVAVEVRRLAQSAASASSEVKVLIEQSGAEVKSGSKLVADAAARLEAMLEAARSSNALMDGIARESREQASAIEEVNTAVRQLDEMTQHNAALVEETNAAIEQTESQANELDRVVDIFTVSGSAPAARAVPAAAAPRGGIKGLQDKVKKAAKSYLSHGNAAIDKDWAEF